MPELPRPALPGPDTARAALPRDTQERVNKAIDRGASWIRKQQKVNGTFADRWTTALSALPALTLLECGATPDDPVVQKAARFVRSHAGRLQSGKDTYELSLALLLLDRLGAREDRPLIRLIAMRLVAGQQPDGGWSYECPLLSEKEETSLVTVLRMTRPQPMGPVKGAGGPAPLGPPIRGGERGAELGSPTALRSGEPGAPTRNVADGLAGPGVIGKAVVGERPASPEVVRKAVNKLPGGLREVPAVKEGTRRPGVKPPSLRPARSDNSNTQFATLALWAALRHGLPVERSLELNARRFRTFQLADGSWKYYTTTSRDAMGTPAMTGAGLLGLAVGHGLENAQGGDRARIDDPAVTRGLEALGRYVGKALGAEPVRPLVKGKGKGRPRQPPQARSPINLYFLWTVERVGVLYNVRELGGKDWYRWAVDQLLDTQAGDGWWEQGNYHGSTRVIDTCLALLVLKRADLVADLSGRLEFVIRTVPRKP